MNVFDEFYKGLHQLSSENVSKLAKHVVDNQELFQEFKKSTFSKFIQFYPQKQELFRTLLVQIYDLLKEFNKFQSNEFLYRIGTPKTNKYGLKIFEDSIETIFDKFVSLQDSSVDSSVDSSEDLSVNSSEKLKDCSEESLDDSIEYESIEKQLEKLQDEESEEIQNEVSEQNNKNKLKRLSKLKLNDAILRNSIEDFKSILNDCPESQFSYAILCQSKNDEFFRILERMNRIDPVKVIEKCIRYRINYDLMIHCILSVQSFSKSSGDRSSSLEKTFEESSVQSFEKTFEESSVQSSGETKLEFGLEFSVRFSNFDSLRIILDLSEGNLRFFGTIDYNLAFSDDDPCPYNKKFIEFILKNPKVILTESQKIGIICSKPFNPLKIFNLIFSFVHENSSEGEIFSSVHENSSEGEIISSSQSGNDQRNPSEGEIISSSQSRINERNPSENKLKNLLDHSEKTKQIQTGIDLRNPSEDEIDFGFRREINERPSITETEMRFAREVFKCLEDLYTDSICNEKLNGTDVIQILIDFIGLNRVRNDFECLEIFKDQFLSISFLEGGIKSKNKEKLMKIFVSVFRENIKRTFSTFSVQSSEIDKNDLAENELKIQTEQIQNEHVKTKEFNLFRDVLKVIENDIRENRQRKIDHKQNPELSDREFEIVFGKSNRGRHKLSVFIHFLKECGYEFNSEDQKEIKRLKSRKFK